MSAVARWCVRRRFAVLGAWVLILAVLVAGVLTLGSKFSDTSNPTSSESSTAYSLQATTGTATPSGSIAGKVVWHTTDGTSVADPTVKSDVATVLGEIRTQPGVLSVVTPYTANGTAQVSTSTNTAYANVTVTKEADTDAITAIADTLDSRTLEAQTGGKAFAASAVPSEISEIIGLLAALVVLLVMFRSVWAAALSLITGITGVAASVLSLILVSHVVDLGSTTLTMGALIGLGVGIDYALFIVNRFRKAVVAGASVADAISQAVNTSGRAVVFAGATVVIALLAVFVVQIDLLTVMARGAAFTVAITMATALTLLPALLAILGNRVLSPSQRRTLAAGTNEMPTGDPSPAVARATAGNHRAPGTRASIGARWAGQVERSPKRLAALATLVMIVLAVPALGMRLGSADASSDPVSSTSNAYYRTMSAAFGPGYDSSLLLVAQTPDVPSTAAFAALTRQVATVDDVTAVTAVPSRDSAVSVITVTPSSSSQAESTSDLVTRLRGSVVPAAERGTQLQVYVGGTTASAIDISSATLSKIPLYLGLVAVLGFVLLAVAFRSLGVALIGTVGNLLTLAVGLGALTAVFQWGWGTQLLGIGSSAPIESVVPVLVIGIMFGLSMDYQVFLVSRMHEEWTHTRDDARAIRVGLSETSRVIASAAVIMTCVFASFGFSGQRIVGEIGVGLAVAVLADAFLLRMVLVPAVMHLIGQRTWSYPRWADRMTPHLSVEGGSPQTPPAGVEAPSEPEPQPVLVSAVAPR